jgi:hypothetical protein
MIERAEGRLRWEGGTTILVTGCEDRLTDSMVLWDLFGSVHPAAADIISHDLRLAEWVACVKKLPLKRQELPPALIMDIDDMSSLDRAVQWLNQIRGLLIEPTPIILVTAAKEHDLAHTVDIVIECTEPPKGRPSKDDWRLVKSRFQSTAPIQEAKQPLDLSPIMMGVARFYYDRALVDQSDTLGWETFLAGWEACFAWQREAAPADRLVHASEIGRKG